MTFFSINTITSEQQNMNANTSYHKFDEVDTKFINRIEQTTDDDQIMINLKNNNMNGIIPDINF
jgi:hypothetical protein